jgi:hypothetical protein
MWMSGLMRGVGKTMDDGCSFVFYGYGALDVWSVPRVDGVYYSAVGFVGAVDWYVLPFSILRDSDLS